MESEPLRLVIDGERPISKKNSKRLIHAKGRVIPISSKAFMDFEKAALAQLATQPRKFFQGDVEINYIFHLKGRLRIDCDNAIAGINDILELAGILENDDQITKGSFEKIRGCETWRTELVIKEIV